MSVWHRLIHIKPSHIGHGNVVISTGTLLPYIPYVRITHGCIYAHKTDISSRYIPGHTHPYRTLPYAGILGHTDLHIWVHSRAYRTHTSTTIRTNPTWDLGLINIYQCIYIHTHTYILISSYMCTHQHIVYISDISPTPRCCPAVGSHTDTTMHPSHSHAGVTVPLHTWQCDRSKPMC